MLETTTILEAYLRAIRELSDAVSVSFYLTHRVGEGKGALIHCGEGTPPPELESLKAAESFVHSEAGREIVTEGVVGPQSAARQMRSTDADCRLVWLPLPLERTNEQPEDRRAGHEARSEDALGAWVGFRLAAERRDEPILLTPLGARQEGESDSVWDGLLSLGGVLAIFSSEISRIMKDPVSGLPDRREFNSMITEEIDIASRTSSPIALLFVNPDEFIRVNEVFGHGAGDRAVREVGERLRETLRAKDRVTRYGGVTFAAILVGQTEQQAKQVAQRLLHQLSKEPYLDGSLQLDFSVGLAVYEPENAAMDDPMQLVQRSDQALNAAKRAGGAALVMWEQEGGEELESFDRLTGIFTGNVAKDYRNMVLLWDTVNVVARNDVLESLASEATKRLFEVLKPERVALYSTSEEGEPEFLHGYARDADIDAGAMRELENREISGVRLELMVQAIRGLEPSRSVIRGDATAEGSEEARRGCYAVPLTKGDSCLGVIYLEVGGQQRDLDASDMLFLRSLGLQLAMALDRIRLAEREVQRQESEKRLLRAELNGLRQAVQRAKFVYRSPEMEALMTKARRVAETDATVLVTGPSGTGKELLARTMHELSPRKDKEFVIVDCGAIPTTLIESELFGHEKGAYTGADRRSAGLIAKAAGGTVLLDEIGELPLSVQTKLLRFVQDKVFTSVGGNQTRKVDVRILAATNRRLESEVAAGRFREDLYYRLNVVQLEVPPLAERPGDIMLLARHFLELYAVQYQKNVRGFSDDAGLSLVNHGWPGNVRELQNRLMQAVLLCDQEVLTPEELNLQGSGGERTVLPFSTAQGESQSADAPTVEGSDGTDVVTDPARPAPLHDAADAVPGESVASLVEGLRSRLGAEISAVSVDSGEIPPLGRWLGEELLLVADEIADGGLNRGARVVGIPASTYRRRLARAKEGNGFAQSPRPEDWVVVRDILRLLAAQETDSGVNLQAVTEHALLNEILARYPGNTRVGSALMGVTPPTFRSRVAELSAAQAVGADR